MTFKVGSAVRFNAPTGSWGRVVSENNYGGYYVEWCYGVDVKGEPITAKSSVKPTEIVPVPEALYVRITSAPAWSDQQKRAEREFV